MKSTLFRDAKLKVKWANKHINQLNSALNAFRKKNFYRFWTEDNPKGTGSIVKFEMTKNVPDKVPLILGDAIHNLRAALDYVAYELSAMTGNTPGDFGHLPIRDTCEKVIAALNGGAIEGLSPEFMTFIAKTIMEPHQSRKSLSLFTLHTLDLADKHRKFLPIFSFAGMMVTTKQGGAPLEYLLFSTGGGDVDVANLTSDTKIQHYNQPTIDVLFDNIQGLDREAIIPTLLQLSELVTQTIEKIEDRLVRSRGAA